MKILDELKEENDRLREALRIIAAQSSGVPGSTDKADCMAALARVALRDVEKPRV